MDSFEFMRKLRESTPRLPADTILSTPHDISLATKKAIRPDAAKLIETMWSKIAQWRATSTSTGGLFTEENSEVRSLNISELEELFGVNLHDFCHNMSKVMFLTTELALRVVMKEDEKAICSHGKIMQTVKGTCPFHEHVPYANILALEISPGMDVISEFIYASLILQETPDIVRACTIVKNSIPLILEWASQSEGGFGAIQKGILLFREAGDLDIPINELDCVKESMKIHVSADGEESIVFSEKFFKVFNENNGFQLATQKAKHRIGCLALQINTNGNDIVTDSVLWAIEIMRSQWQRLTI